MIHRRHLLSASAAGLALPAQAMSRAHATRSLPVRLVEAQDRPSGFELPIRAALEIGGLAGEARIGADRHHVELFAAGRSVARLGAPACEVHARDFLNIATALVFNPASHTLWVACADAKLHIFNAAGQWQRLAALTAQAGDAPGQCMSLSGVAVGDDGSVYLADTVLGLLHVFAADGEFVARHALIRQELMATAGFRPRYWQPRGLRISDKGVQVWVTPDHSGGFAVCRELQDSIA